MRERLLGRDVEAQGLRGRGHLLPGWLAAHTHGPHGNRRPARPGSTHLRTPRGHSRHLLLREVWSDWFPQVRSHQAHPGMHLHSLLLLLHLRHLLWVVLLHRPLHGRLLSPHWLTPGPHWPLLNHVRWGWAKLGWWWWSASRGQLLLLLLLLRWLVRLRQLRLWHRSLLLEQALQLSRWWCAPSHLLLLLLSRWNGCWKPNRAGHANCLPIARGTNLHAGSLHLRSLQK